ncbi:MAG: thioredoxin family protein [Chitinophagaceae bacterium]|nr:thioredoxin family protein [Chitinophagaceae bacterium]
MKKLLIFIFALLGNYATLWAQVKAEATAIRSDAGKGVVTLKILVDSNISIFSVKPRNTEDGFISSVSFEEGTRATISEKEMVEKGDIKTVSNEAVGENATVLTGEIILEIPVTLDNDSSQVIKGVFNYLGIEGDNYPSGAAEFAVEMPAFSAGGTGNQTETTGSGEEPKKGWALFLITFLVGFGAVFTPCVFPLMPVTVSFFLKKSKTKAEGIRNAWIYALSIVLIYTIPTLIFTLIFGDKFLYQLSTHPVSNLLFFLIFLVFAISFFGAFEITLPSSWANKTDSAAQKGGLIGIFFMALTLVIVSFSCTGPIVGALLGETSGKGIGLGPVIGMLGFGFGLAIPFGVLALFPSMLKSLPKSGGWLNTVKVFFGFIELALAMKFFSNADLVYHWGILTRPVFLAGWIVIFTLLGLYLVGKLKFSHDSDLPFISVPRIFIAMTSFTFALYMLPGMWGAPLKPLSGILPPPSTQDFDLDKLQYMSGGTYSGHGSSSSNSAAPPPSKYVDKFHVPFGLTAYYDIEEAKAASKILKKPIMIDFTGWSCANCRKMENEVWSKPEILERLRNDFVLVSLYVDDKTELPFKEQYTNEKGEKITTIGDKNLEYQTKTFNFNAQPLYKFMDHEDYIFSPVQYGYDPDVTKFAAHLDAMKEAYKAKWP